VDGFGFAGFGTLVARQDGGVQYLSHGGGFAMWAGLELGRIIGLEARYGSSFHDPINTCLTGTLFLWCDENYLLVQTFGIDLKLHVPTNTRVVPYVVVGPMVGWVGRQRHAIDAVGGGFEIGGGVDVWFSRHGTIGAELRYRGLGLSDYADVIGTNTYLSLVQIGGTIAGHYP